MAITNFIPEIWASQLLVELRKTLVFGSPTVVNRDYEGEIREAGDRVRITSISRPTIKPYVKNSTKIAPELLTDAKRTLIVDQAQSFAFLIDDIDYRQSVSGGALMSQAASESAYGLADTFDKFIATTTAAGAGTKIASAVVNTPDLATAKLIELSVALDAKNVSTQGRFVVVPPEFHGLLLGSQLFSRWDASGVNAPAGITGKVGEAFGFTVLKSNNVVTAAKTKTLLAGVNGGTTVAEQINSVEAYRPQDSFSDAIKGLQLYGALVARPDDLATAVVDMTPAP